MKVTFKNMVHGYTGYADELIFYQDRRTGKIYARKAFWFKKHKGQPPFRVAQQQIYKIKPAEFYRYNLKDYCAFYNNLPQNRLTPIFTWCHVYNKMMWAMQAAMPDTVDLKTINREQIYTQNLPCITLKAAIEAGLLPMVEKYERWNVQI